jgi:hypothetical protein
VAEIFSHLVTILIPATKWFQLRSPAEQVAEKLEATSAASPAAEAEIDCSGLAAPLEAAPFQNMTDFMSFFSKLRSRRAPKSFHVEQRLKRLSSH